MTPLLAMKKILIEGYTGESWEPIIKGLDLTLNNGEVLGLIGESGAGKSTFGLAAMGYTRQGCRIASGSIVFDGQELFGMPESQLRDIRGARIAYVAQSAAASFNPAHRLIRQYAEGPVEHGLMSTAEAEKKSRGHLRSTASSRSGEYRLPFSSPGVRRSIAACHGGHGHELPARHHHL